MPIPGQTVLFFNLPARRLPASPVLFADWSTGAAVGPAGAGGGGGASAVSLLEGEVPPPTSQRRVS